MTNYSVGHKAERQAANYIKALGYKVISMNWKNRVCEIDIIAQKDQMVHFIEVKYRQNDLQGGGFEYITANKLKQMGFAAKIWIHENNWDQDYCLGAIELSGPNFKVTNFVDTT